MGNRAIVKPVNSDIGVYLHWHGGIDSVSTFLKYCKLRGFREFNDPYGVARFCQIVGNYIGGDLSIGVESGIEGTEKCAEGLDNCIYVVDGWDVVDYIGGKPKSEEYDVDELLQEIDEAQPESERLGVQLKRKRGT